MKRLIAIFTLFLALGMANAQKTPATVTYNNITYNVMDKVIDSKNNFCNEPDKKDIFFETTDYKLKFTIYNMPSQSSGTFDFYNHYSDNGGSGQIACNLVAMGQLENTNNDASFYGFKGSNGKLTKTGLRSFKFVYNFTNHRDISGTVEGSCSY